VPISIKEVVWMRDLPCTNGSRALEGFVPAEDAVVVERLRAAGAVVVGKTNNPEFCYSGTTDNDVYGLTRNPHDLGRTPGGSSGGAAAATAYGAVPLSVGTDAGGSVRIPASFCGVIGFKPTFGLVPQTPGWPGYRTLNAIGPLVRSVRDAALWLDVVAGPDPSDYLSLPARALLDGRKLEEISIAASADLGYAPVEPAVADAFAAAVAQLRGAGLPIADAHPGTADPSALWSTIAWVECTASELPLVEDRIELVRPESRKVFELGKRWSGPDYAEAQNERTAYNRRWLEFLREHGLLITPTMQMTAFPVGLERPSEIAGKPVDEDTDDWCAFIYPANLAGLPAITIPWGADEAGLPIGLQIIGAPCRDADVIAAAAFAVRIRDEA
jgi:Asp-tRNA(Asn)/Glu-tRNA(Gln) amidotransferase A subunit family amidase